MNIFRNSGPYTWPEMAYDKWQHRLVWKNGSKVKFKCPDKYELYIYQRKCINKQEKAFIEYNS